MTDMGYPSKQEAQDCLDKGHRRNPGPWAAHCLVAARCAESIASHIPHLDPEKAYVSGLLHDIGRSAGPSHLRHVINGYEQMNSQGYPAVARICLTHSFPVKDIRIFSGTADVSNEEFTFLQGYISDADYDDYDRLIQLCDTLALPSGPCIVEQRLVDIAIRYGLFDFSIEKWKAYMALKEYFDRAAGVSVYSLIDIVL